MGGAVNYYRVFCEDRKGIPVASSKSEVVLPLATSRERAQLLKEGLEVRGTALTDYLANDVGGRLCSARMRSVLEGVKGERDSLTFLEVPVKTTSGVQPFYFLRFLRPDGTVLNKERSIMAGEAIVKPVLSKANITGREVFTIPGDEDVIWFVSQTAKDALIASGCTGIEFGKAPIL